MKFQFTKTTGPDSFTFPPIEVELDADVVKDLGLRSALRVIAQRMFDAYEDVETHNGCVPVGIDIHSVSFSFILGTPAPPSAKLLKLLEQIPGFPDVVHDEDGDL